MNDILQFPDWTVVNNDAVLCTCSVGEFYWPAGAENRTKEPPNGNIVYLLLVRLESKVENESS